MDKGKGRSIYIDKKKVTKAIEQYIVRFNMNAQEIGRLANTSSSYINYLRRGDCDSVAEKPFERVCNVIGRSMNEFIIPEPERYDIPEADEEMIPPAAIPENFYDQLYKTVYAALFAVMEQFWK